MKRGIALLMCLIMMAGLAACGDTAPDPATQTASSDTVTTVPDTDTDTEASTSSKTEEEVEIPSSHKVLACDQYNRRVVLYDLDLLSKGDSLDDGEIWSLDEAGYAADMKYREGSVFGDVVIVAGTYVTGIYAYPEKTAHFTTTTPGSNPHAVELLPSGNLVVANSDGNSLRLFYSSAVLDGVASADVPRYKEYELKGAHGLVWDPKNEVLWALGDEELAAYALSGEGTEESLSKISGMGSALPKSHPGGHDLSADLTDPDYLLLSTNKGPLRYDKEENTFLSSFQQSSQIPTSFLKAVSRNEEGSFFFLQTTGGKGTAWENMNISGWCSDQISAILVKGNKAIKTTYKSETSAFYKCRVFCGQYQ